MAIRDQLERAVCRSNRLETADLAVLTIDFTKIPPNHVIFVTESRKDLYEKPDYFPASGEGELYWRNRTMPAGAPFLVGSYVLQNSNFEFPQKMARTAATGSTRAARRTGPALTPRPA